MSKYEGMSAQNCASRNMKVTLSLYPKAVFSDNNSLQFLSDSSYVKFNIREKAKNITVYHNIGIKKVRSLYREVQARYVRPELPFSWSETKIFGNYPKKEEDYRLACQKAGVPYNPPVGGDLCSDARKIYITYEPLKPDGTPSNYPWTIVIKNGMSRVKRGKVNGSFYEGSKSYAPKAESRISLDTDEMFNLLTEQIEYFRYVADRARDGMFANQGVTGLLERQSRIDEWQNNQEWRENTPPEPIQQPRSVASVVIASEFQSSEYGVCATCNFSNGPYVVNFKAVTDDMKKAQAFGSPLKISWWQDNDNGWIYADVVE